MNQFPVILMFLFILTQRPVPKTKVINIIKRLIKSLKVLYLISPQFFSSQNIIICWTIFELDIPRKQT